MKRGEILLAVGLGCTACGAALTQFVIIGLGGLLLLAIAFVLLMRAALVSRFDADVPAWQQVTGFIVYLSAVLSLFGIALLATSSAQSAALMLQRGIPVTEPMNWLLLLCGAAAAAFELSAGLWLITGRSPARVLPWGLAAFSVTPLAVMLFWLLSGSQPITA